MAQLHRGRRRVDVAGEPRADPVGQPGLGVGLVHHDRDAAPARGEVGRQGDVAAEADHDLGVDAVQHGSGGPDGLHDPRGNLQQGLVRPARHRHRRDQLERVTPGRDEDGVQAAFGAQRGDRGRGVEPAHRVGHGQRRFDVPGAVPAGDDDPRARSAGRVGREPRRTGSSSGAPDRGRCRWPRRGSGRAGVARPPRRGSAVATWLGARSWLGRPAVARPGRGAASGAAPQPRGSAARRGSADAARLRCAGSAAGSAARGAGCRSSGRRLSAAGGLRRRRVCGLGTDGAGFGLDGASTRDEPRSAERTVRGARAGRVRPDGGDRDGDPRHAETGSSARTRCARRPRRRPGPRRPRRVRGGRRTPASPARPSSTPATCHRPRRTAAGSRSPAAGPSRSRC